MQVCPHGSQFVISFCSSMLIIKEFEKCWKFLSWRFIYIYIKNSVCCMLSSPNFGCDERSTALGELSRRPDVQDALSLETQMTPKFHRHRKKRRKSRRVCGFVGSTQVSPAVGLLRKLPGRYSELLRLARR